MKKATIKYFYNDDAEKREYAANDTVIPLGCLNRLVKKGVISARIVYEDIE